MKSKYDKIELSIEEARMLHWLGQNGSVELRYQHLYDLIQFKIKTIENGFGQRYEAVPEPLMEDLNKVVDSIVGQGFHEDRDNSGEFYVLTHNMIVKDYEKGLIIITTPLGHIHTITHDQLDRFAKNRSDNKKKLEKQMHKLFITMVKATFSQYF